MSTPSAKKRRVDIASATLRKPFTSPVIKRPPTNAPPPESSSGLKGADSRHHSSAPAEPDDLSQEAPSPQRVHKAPRELLDPRQLHDPQQFTTSRGLKPKSSQSRLTDDNPLLSLVIQHRKDQANLVKQLDQQLETVHQAKRIVTQSATKRPGEPVDQDLRDLIEKWKEGSRQAAEELFDFVKERVSNAGGIKAWNAMRRNQMQFYQGFDEVSPRELHVTSDDELVGNQGGSDSLTGDVTGSTSPPHPADNGEATDEGDFDLFAMLQSLNIDPCVLGYDPARDG